LGEQALANQADRLEAVIRGGQETGCRVRGRIIPLRPVITPSRNIVAFR